MSASRFSGWDRDDTKRAAELLFDIELLIVASDPDAARERVRELRRLVLREDGFSNARRAVDVHALHHSGVLRAALDLSAALDLNAATGGDS